MKNIFDLSVLEWELCGFYPEEWYLNVSHETGVVITPEIGPIKVDVPGSVQKALFQHGLMPDWNIGLNARCCEWVENRQWVFQAKIPDHWLCAKKRFVLNCQGLDGFGEIWVNKIKIICFKNSFLPYCVDITSALKESQNVIEIIFTCPPRWLGQIGYTSKVTEWKPRFNYRWDWTARLVQIGIWDKIQLFVTDDVFIESLCCTTSVDIKNSSGMVSIKGLIRGGVGYNFKIEISDDSKIVVQQHLEVNTFNTNGMSLNVADVELWNPSGMGEPKLYLLKGYLIGPDGKKEDSCLLQIGFREISWNQCLGSPPDADPWICTVNGRSIFLKGVNWTPIRPNFADVSLSEYRKRLNLYKKLGFNLIRVWGGAFLEREEFYQLCDQLGLMVWQEFPLSSSGIDNYPPDTAVAVEELVVVAESFVYRRAYHPSIIMWCGGNELCCKNKPQIPLTLENLLMRRFEDVIKKLDNGRRFVPSSPLGPRFCANSNEYGRGVHWDVHGPWKVSGAIEHEWISYWEKDDALFRSEVGAPGASDVRLIRRYQGEYDPMPPSLSNPLWNRFAWWCEDGQYVSERNHSIELLEDYVAWSQERQAKALTIAAKACLDRFPRCGGIIVWMGHDCFPCTANTSIIDFEGNPKPAAVSLSTIFGGTY